MLETLLAEYDGSPQTWYLLALAHYGCGAFEEASEALVQGLAHTVCLSGPKLEELEEMYSELQERIQEGVASAAAHVEDDEQGD